MWVRFTGNFDWKPKASVTLAYFAGQEKNVTRTCAAEAIAKGKAVAIRRDRKPDEGQGKVSRS